MTAADELRALTAAATPGPWDDNETIRRLLDRTLEAAGA